MDKKTKLETVFLGALSLFTVSFVALLIIARWPEWWMWVIFERTPMTWLESMLLYTSTIIAFAIAGVEFLTSTLKNTFLWAFYGMGFLFLTLDERFALHERLRDFVLIPNDIHPGLFFWTSPGDYILVIMALCSIALVPVYYKLFAVRKSALVLKATGFGIALTAVFLDSLHVTDMAMETQRLLQFYEEILETTAMLLFCSALFLLFMDKLNPVLLSREKP
ncbi:MAG: hypothetical protein ABUK01_10675 [Leptospirales bacterium]